MMPMERPAQKTNVTHLSSQSVISTQSGIDDDSIRREEEHSEDNDGDRHDLNHDSGTGSYPISLGSRTAALPILQAGSLPPLGFALAGGWTAFSSSPNRAIRRPNGREREEIRREELDLLSDCHVVTLGNSHAGKKLERSSERGSNNERHDGRCKHGRIPSNEAGPCSTIESNPQPSATNDQETDETTHLLPPSSPPNPADGLTNDEVDRTWAEAVLSGKIKTSWRRESQVLARSSAPLILTFILQYSLTVTSIFTIGHLGTVELAAVSLASMTANITGYAVYQGCATSLDTLCAQAYGSGRRMLVGLQTQRMVYFLWLLTLPIAMIWLCADLVLHKIVPEAEVARLAGIYLKIALVGTPGYACYESIKRYLQAQGIFSASLYVLLICAPANILLHWLLVWKLKLGFIGAPIAVAIVDTLLPLGLVLYIVAVNGKNCWPGLTRRAFTNWGPMIRLALPGFIMVEAEVAAFEILTLAASYFGTKHLAAQSILSTIASITFQIPFPISIASSTRIANLIGATLADAAKSAARTAMVVAVLVGTLNATFLFILRDGLPRLFSDDEVVRGLAAQALPLCAAFQLFDALAACCNGVLRGLGRQEIGGFVQLAAYYLVAMPISMGFAFGLGWDLIGLWAGVAIALGLVAGIEGLFLWKIEWQQSVEDARARNERAL